MKSFLAFGFELQPLLHRRSDFLLECSERGADLFKGSAIARIKLWIVEFCVQRIGFGLQHSNGLRQSFERVLVLETHPPLGGLRFGDSRGGLAGASLRFDFL